MGNATAAATKTPEELEAEQQAADAAAAEAEAKKKADDEAAAAAAAGGEGGEDEGLDVVEEGANAGADDRGKVVPLRTHIQQKQKWKGKAKTAQDDAAARAQEAELLKLQLQQRDEELARLKAAQKGPPKRSDYESDEAFEQAREKHARAQTEALVVDVLKKHVPAAAAGPAEDDPENDPELQAHYDRAAKLRAADFDEREDKVIEAIGAKAARQIIKQYPNSEALVYALGGNPEKLAELASGLKKDPVRAVINLTQYAATLKLQPRKKAPAPDPADERKSTLGQGDAQKQLDALRAKQQKGEASMDDVMKFKRECRRKGIEVA